MCVREDGFVPLVLRATGFAYVNEGTEEKPKKGFVANTTGAELVFRVDSSGLVSSSAGGPGVMIPASLAHLKSYKGMGTATVR